jgi:hypothetical protein
MGMRVDLTVHVGHVKHGWRFKWALLLGMFLQLSPISFKHYWGSIWLPPFLVLIARSIGFEIWHTWVVFATSLRKASPFDESFFSWTTHYKIFCELRSVTLMWKLARLFSQHFQHFENSSKIKWWNAIFYHNIQLSKKFVCL